MRPFEYTFLTLTKVVEEQLPFRLALKSAFKSQKRMLDNSFKASVASMSGCVLRNYYLFKEIVNRKYPELKENKFLLIAIGLANHAIKNEFDETELFKFIEKETELEDVVDFIKGYDNPLSLMPKDIPLHSHKYYSLRCNIPLWVVRMWHRNCGEALSRSIFHAVSRFKNVDVRINSQNISDEEFFEKYNDFAKTDESNYAAYTGEGRLRKHPALVDDALFIPQGYKYIFDDLDLDPIRGIAAYCGSNNHILEELYLRLGNDYKIDYVCGHQKHYFETLTSVKQLKLSNVSTYEVDVDALRTCISKPVHNFFLCPRNSNFEQLMYQPDFFLSCDQELLDEYINEETKSLNEAASLVEDGGYIIYLVPTLCRNETKTVVHEFVNNNPDYKLEKELQLLPLEKFKTMLYFAVIRKEVNHD